MNLSFKKRIALGFMTATALIIALAFACVYMIVQKTVYDNIDYELKHQATIHSKQVKRVPNGLRFVNKLEWEEREHREAEVNPVFLQLTDHEGKLMDKSPNLKANRLYVQNAGDGSGYFNTILNGKHLRQVQTPVHIGKQKVGFIIAAVSLEPSLMLIGNLRWTLFILYPITLIVVFVLSSFLAGRSIAPVQQIIRKTNSIKRNNLNERIPLPASQDELYALAEAINGMLQRLEDAMVREQQFTADASHELRTPLTVMRGTLEVLLRRNRTEEVYKEKIEASLVEINRMTDTVENLLELARLENSSGNLVDQEGNLVQLLTEIADQQVASWQDKNLHVKWKVQEDAKEAMVPEFHTRLILANIIGNAFKYSGENGTVSLEVTTSEDGLTCKVSDEGLGINPEDATFVHQPFFRSFEADRLKIKGTGLGLSIAEKAAKAIDARIHLAQNQPRGTVATVHFLRKF